MAGDAVEILNLAFGKLSRGVLFERGEVGGKEGLQRRTLRGGQREVWRGGTGLFVVAQAALVAGLEHGRERGLSCGGHTGVAIEATGADEQGGPAGGVAGERLALDDAAVGDEVGRELRGFLFFQAEMRHTGRWVVLGWILQVFHERGGMPLVGDVSHRNAVLRVLAFGVRALVAGDTAQVSEERAALRGELKVDRASLGRGALREHGGEVGGLLVGIGAGEDLRHQRVRTDGVRVADPVGEEG